MSVPTYHCAPSPPETGMNMQGAEMIVARWAMGR